LSGDIDKPVPRNNAVLKIKRNGELVPVKLKEGTKRFNTNNFARVRQEVAKQGLDENDPKSCEQGRGLLSGDLEEDPACY
jgi:hypothetical protein